MNKKLLLSALITVVAGAAYAQTFPGTGLGPIPDRGTAGCGLPAGEPLDITFTVTDVFSPLSVVEVDMEANHSWVGDLDVRLIAPDATEHVVFASTGSTTLTGCGSADDLAGVYNFTDTGTDDWWLLDNPYPAGDYQTTTAGDDPSGGVATSINAAFAAVVDPNGTWTLRVTDSGGGDTGDVTDANLFLLGAPNPDVIFEDGFETPPPV